MGISNYGGLVGQPGVGLSTGDFKRQLEWALEVEHLSLWELCEETLERGLPCWGPWSIGRKGSGDGRLVSIEALLGNLEGCLSNGDLERWM
jgi:hypothetical protein